MSSNLLNCAKCDGCGKLDNKDGKPWGRFLGLNVPEIHRGEILPVVCPDCKGRGVTETKTPSPPPQPAVIETHRAEDGTILGVVLEDGTRVGTFPAPIAVESEPPPVS